MNFSETIAEFARKSGMAASQVKRGVALKLFSAVILDTPVLTGRLRSNWVATSGQPSSSTQESSDKTGSVTVELMKQQVLLGGEDSTLYLTNNLPYAHRIEFEGWSHTKAPAGMVRKNVLRFERLLKQEIENLR